jgi:hypothetical protein
VAKFLCKNSGLAGGEGGIRTHGTVTRTTVFEFEDSVILEAGTGNKGDIWSMVEPKAAAKNSVFDGVAAFTRVCAYDRPGTIPGSPRSRSDPAPMPRSAGDIVADLRAPCRRRRAPKPPPSFAP